MTDRTTKQHPIIASLAKAFSVMSPEQRDAVADEIHFAVEAAYIRETILTAFGPVVPVDEIESLATVAAESYAAILDKSPALSAGITATVRDIAAQIGELIDYSIRRMHGPDGKLISRRAYLDVVAGHATLMRGLTALNDISDDDNGNAAA